MTERQHHEEGGFIALGGKCQFALGMPLSAYDAVGGSAFVARMRGSTATDLMAILCRNGYTPRNEAVNALRRIDNPAVLRLIDHGVVELPDGQRCFGFALEQPQNPRLWASLDETRPPLGEDFINTRFIRPLAEGLHAMADAGVMHGGVRLTNIFWRESSTNAPVLGECVSAAPGIGQPALFEPLERALAQPAARGVGSSQDDMYALGITVLLLVLGRNPFKNIEEAALLRQRLERGSFVAMTGEHKLAPSHVELMRGLLQDDPAQRWTPHDLMQWLGGQRLSPKQSDFNRRATRALSFMGKDYTQVRPLLPQFWANVTEASKLIQSGELDRWLRRSLADQERADRVQVAQEMLRDGGRSAQQDEQLVTLTAIALDPNMPIAYRGLMMMPAGVGGALAEAMRQGGNLQALAEVIGQKFVGFWINQQSHGKADLVPLAQTYDRMSSLLERTGYGQGLERVVYELNPALGCLSPLLRGQSVIMPRDLLPALERAAAQPNRPREPIDRQIAAWMVARDRMAENYLRGLGSSQALPRILAMLNMCNGWQEKHGPDKVSALSGWLAASLEPLTRRFYNRKTRTAVAGALQQVVAGGKLRDLARILDDGDMLARDQKSFAAARQLYQMTLQQIAVLERQRKHHDEVAKVYGRPAATYIAWVIAVMAMVFTIMRSFAG